MEEQDFAVTVSTIDESPRINEDIELVAELLIKTKNSVQILHASPLIHVQIYDEQSKPLINTLATDLIGINHTLQPNELYNPDSSRFNNGKRIIQIEKPGTYKLIGTATFSIPSSNGQPRDYEISSTPIELVVK